MSQRFKPGDRVVKNDIPNIHSVVVMSTDKGQIILDDGKSYNPENYMPLQDAIDYLKHVLKDLKTDRKYILDREVYDFVQNKIDVLTIDLETATFEENFPVISELQSRIKQYQKALRILHDNI